MGGLYDTLSPEYRLQMEEQEQKKALAKMLMQKSLQGPQIQQSGTHAAKISPWAMLANVGTGYFADKHQRDATSEQAKIQRTADDATQASVTGLLNAPNQEEALAQALASKDPRFAAVAKVRQEAKVKKDEQEFKALQESLKLGVNAMSAGGDTTRAVQAAQNRTLGKDPYLAPELKQPEVKFITGPDGKPIPQTTNYNLQGQGRVTLGASGTTNTLTAETKLAGEEGKLNLAREQKDLTDMQETARTAQQNIATAQKVGNLLRDGAVAGGGGTVKQMARKVAQAFGVTVPETGFTDELRSRLGEALLKHAKAFGSNPTDRDARITSEIVGNIDTDPMAIMHLQASISAKAHKDLEDFGTFIDIKRQGKNAPFYDTADVGIGRPKSVAGTEQQRLLIAQDLVQQGVSPEKVSQLTGINQSQIPDGAAKMSFSLPGLVGGPAPVKKENAQPDIEGMSLEQVQAEIAKRRAGKR